MSNHDRNLDATFRALADPTRRAVLSALGDGQPRSVTDLARPFDMALPSFLRHLRVLEDGGLVRTEKQGRTRLCRLDAPRLAEVESWVAARRAAWERRFDRLDAVALTIDRKEDQHDPQ